MYDLRLKWLPERLNIAVRWTTTVLIALRSRICSKKPVWAGSLVGKFDGASEAKYCYSGI